MATMMPERDWTGYRERCGGAGCNQPVKPGRLLCEQCSDRMDEIKADFYEIDTDAVFVSGGRTIQKKPKSLGPTCCYPSCYNPRIPPEVFCYTHEDEEVESD